MNRRDSNLGGQQPGGYRNEDSDWESPRQANQWQGDTPRQAGGGWGNEDAGRSLHADETRRRRFQRSDNEGRYRPDPREDAEYGARARYGRDTSYGERSYDDDYRSRRAERDYRFSGDRRLSRDQPVYPIREYDASGGNDFADFTSEDYGGRDFYARRGGGGGLSPSFSYRPTFDTFGRGYYGTRDETRDDRSSRDYGDWREYGEERGFLRRAGDEIASWFGDEDAARRREQDHRGRGPTDYTRSDERIREDVNDRLTQDWRVDATNIRVLAKDGEVTLDGTVGSRHAKRRAEDLADEVSGVKHVQNNLRVIGGTNWTDTGRTDTERGASVPTSGRTTGSVTGGSATASTAGSTSSSGSTITGSTSGSSS